MSEQQVLPSKQKVLALFPEAFSFERDGIWYIGPKPAYVRTLRTAGGQTTESAAWDDALPDAEKCAERQEAYRARALSGEKGKDAQIASLIASLAQSEAERERLQGEVYQKQLLVEEGELYIKRADKAEAALARERGLQQGLRQVVKQYRVEHATGECCINHNGAPSRFRGEEDDRCDICKKADALLEPQPAPVVTGEK